jgi:hypothetical protein
MRSCKERSTLPPERVTKISDSLNVRPDNWSAPITSPANAVITTISRSVRPVSSMQFTIPFNEGLVSFCKAPTMKVSTTAAIPAFPASQFWNMSV